MKTPLTAASPTDCKSPPRWFQDLRARKVLADFSGGTLSSDGGVLLLRQVDAGLGVTRSLAACFVDGRDQIYVDHTVQQMVAQRVYGLALGYEDLNDHQWLRLDPLLAAACEKRDPTGQDRFNPAHRGVALAGASTLNRLELSNKKQTRAHKLAHDPERVEDGWINIISTHQDALILYLNFGHGRLSCRHVEQRRTAPARTPRTHRHH